jgi:hypothetical protein
VAESATVSIRSRSAIPQYDVQVYLVAVRNGRYVAAGQVAVAHLATNGSTRVTVGMVGSSNHAALHVIALPTIFT